MRHIARQRKRAPNSSSLIEIAAPKAPLLYRLQNNRVMAVTVHPDLAAFDGLKTRIQILCSGAANSGKSTSPTTEPRERPMHQATTLPVPEQTCSRGDCATLFVSLELSRSTWVATALAPGSRKMSKHTLVGGDGRKLLDLLARLKTRAEQRIAAPVKVVTIHEVGLDGFWIHRLLEANGVESHVVDPASIAVPRRHRRAKTDAIDGETLLRTLMAWQRGEPRVCSMTVPPSPSEEDRRRISRERASLLRERIQHTNRIRGLLFGQGITNYNPLHKNRRECLEELQTGNGQ